MIRSLLQAHGARELELFLPPDRKLEIGCSKGESGAEGGLIAELLEDWIFPASKLWVAYSTSGQIPHSSTTTAVCQTPAVVSAAFDLLVSLCTGCPGNLCQLGTMLADMFYTRETEAVSEWEFLPPVGPRPSQGFVGLKHCNDRGRLAAPRGVIACVCSNHPPNSRRSQFGAVFSDFTLVKPAKSGIMTAVCC